MKAVVFDMDGVIFDSERLVMDIWRKLGEMHHFEGVEKVCQECLGTNKQTSKKIFLKHYGASFPYDEYAAESSKMYHESYDGRLPMKKGVVNLLSYLKSHHYSIALASSTREYTVKLQLKNAGILDYFDAVICGDMVKHSKPDPEIYLTACQALNVLPSDAYGIEDSYNGIRSCTRAGMHAIMVPDLKQPDDEMKQLAEVILPDLDAVCEYIEKQSLA